MKLIVRSMGRYKGAVALCMFVKLRPPSAS